ncbi:DUF6624 domain-containing protein [Mucilaginibacter ximonensis]|uniref:DUF6624 domain-containing protein n=1 Tax=Mucilaginibacter ximonensis TaxID=538021 RepID=A0ABW5YBS8_9SPHI
MKKNTLFILVLFLLLSSYAKSQIIPPYDKIGKEMLFVDTLNARNQTDIKIEELKRQLASATTTKTTTAYYNLAICYAAKNDAQNVCYYLNRCLKSGRGLMLFIMTDTDFEPFRSDDCWKKITQSVDSIYLSMYPKVTDKQLAVKLFHIYLNDQQGRGMGLKKKDKKFFHDEEDLVEVEKIISQYGWPTYTMVGPASANGAFLVLQHASLQVQEKYLNMLAEAVAKNEASKEWFALMTDRISVDKYGYQIYGTQVYKEKDKTTGKYGAYKYAPIKDEAKVDSLRATLGLIPLKQYLNYFDINYPENSK